MWVEFVKDSSIDADGRNEDIHHFTAGALVDLLPGIAEIAIKNGLAKPGKPPVAEPEKPPQEDKDAKKPPETKGAVASEPAGAGDPTAPGFRGTQNLVPQTAVDREKVIVMNMRDMIELNEDLTKAGVPNVDVLSERCKFTVSARERDDLMAKFFPPAEPPKAA